MKGCQLIMFALVLSGVVASPLTCPAPPTNLVQHHYYFHVNLEIALPVTAGTAGTAIAILIWIYRYRNTRENGNDVPNDEAV
ncbi:hypothetical protein L195_g039920 [Trifolium pratense]|uniref:Uncharacterized protein n=1 Tax=Trifolium pratense TaxID=57577 RepID=A0A2K3LZA9_TRIPR|nr:hypothetical protein L195_g039920 [Trifolium pratense]